MNLTHLLNELCRIKAEVEHSQTTNVTQVALLRRTLHEHANAVRDYKFIASLTALYNSVQNQRIDLEAFPDLAKPYKAELNLPYDTRYRTIQEQKRQSLYPVRRPLMKTLPNRLSWTETERKYRRSSYGAGGALETYSRLLDSIARFIIGTLGGCVLIVPMVVMALHPLLTKSLIVVSVALVLFALMIGLLFETDNKDTIAATATYAAVLVVFVGSSGTGTGVGG